MGTKLKLWKLPKKKFPRENVIPSLLPGYMKKGKFWANVMVLKCGAIETPLTNIIDNMMGTQKKN
jgi:hypothetical protein